MHNRIALIIPETRAFVCRRWPESAITSSYAGMNMKVGPAIPEICSHTDNMTTDYMTCNKIVMM